MGLQQCSPCTMLTATLLDICSQKAFTLHQCTFHWGLSEPTPHWRGVTFPGCKRSPKSFLQFLPTCDSASSSISQRLPNSKTGTFFSSQLKNILRLSCEMFYTISLLYPLKSGGTRTSKWNTERKGTPAEIIQTVSILWDRLGN